MSRSLTLARRRSVAPLLFVGTQARWSASTPRPASGKSSLTSIPKRNTTSGESAQTYRFLLYAYYRHETASSLSPCVSLRVSVLPSYWSPDLPFVYNHNAVYNTKKLNVCKIFIKKKITIIFYFFK